MNPRRFGRDLLVQPTSLVLAFFICFFMLSSGGRMASGDAGEQLKATMLFVTTGSLGAAAAPGGSAAGWVKGGSGRYYEPHDIGNVVLMLPAAWLAAVASRSSSAAMVEQPPVASRVGVALTYSLLIAVACFFMFKMFALRHGLRTAFLLSLAFPTTTLFWAYSKGAWDVSGAACLICVFLCFAALALRGNAPGRNITIAAGALALTFLFRFSLAPFFIIALARLIYLLRRRLQWRDYAACLVVFLLLVSPALWYNYVRMGSPLRPATTAPQYLEGNNALTGNILEGIFGLLIAPNRGLFLYSPILLLLFALPFVWRRLPQDQRHLLSSCLIGVVLYVLVVAKMKDWGAFGWGPRYLIPIIPVLFLAVEMAATALWHRRRKLIVTLIAVSAVLSLAPVLVNWGLVTMEFPGARDQFEFMPRQQIGVWAGLVTGLQGKPLPAPPDVRSDPIRSAAARFPDLWTVRLMERSRLGLVAGLSISLILLAVAAWSFRLLVRLDRQASVP